MNCLLFSVADFWRLHDFSLRRALRRQWKKRLLCSEGFCVVVKNPLHFLYVQHERAQNEHAESWLKFTDLQNSLSSTHSSPHPLGLEVMAACDKRAHSFINVRFSIHPAFWKSLNLHEYFISGKNVSLDIDYSHRPCLFHGPRHKQPCIACQQISVKMPTPATCHRGVSHSSYSAAVDCVAWASSHTPFLWDFTREAMPLLIQDGKIVYYRWVVF